MCQRCRSSFKKSTREPNFGWKSPYSYENLRAPQKQILNFKQILATFFANILHIRLTRKLFSRIPLVHKRLERPGKEKTKMDMGGVMRVSVADVDAFLFAMGCQINKKLNLVFHSLDTKLHRQTLN